MLEDSAALLGLVLAFLGMFFGELLGMPWLDGAASILIGILLCAVAYVMVNESRALLVGEGVSKATLEGIRALALADSCVANVGGLRTLYFGPEEVMLVMEVHLRDDSDVVEVRETMGRLKSGIREKYPKVKRVFFDVTPTENQPAKP